MGFKDWARIVIAGTVGRGVFPHQMAFILGPPLRRLLLLDLYNLEIRGGGVAQIPALTLDVGRG